MVSKINSSRTSTMHGLIAKKPNGLHILVLALKLNLVQMSEMLMSAKIVAIALALHLLLALLLALHLLLNALLLATMVITNILAK